VPERSRLRVIRAAAPTVFRYCCARGMKIPPAAPAEMLQRFESLRLLRRCDSVCRNVRPSKKAPHNAKSADRKFKRGFGCMLGGLST
jgi:hypothetical protein